MDFEMVDNGEAASSDSVAPRPAAVSPTSARQNSRPSINPMPFCLSRRNSLPHTLFGSAEDSIFTPLSKMGDRTRIPAIEASLAEPLDPPFIQRTADGRTLPRVEKDADDPTTPPPSSRPLQRQESTTLTTLSRLFSVQAATSPETSRQPSYISQQSRSASAYTRHLHLAETAALPEHLYTRGLLLGRHSDITVHAFGQQYRLHRLILDRAPFFASALSEPWLEAHATEMTVHPEDIDNSITQSAFELALQRLYGSCQPFEESQDPVGLFATGCWLEMQDLIENSIESMLRQMSPETLPPLVKLVTGNYYGRAGDKILASAKSMLCRDGSSMPLKNWDGIPADIIREIVGGDGFFIDGEYDRWVLAKRILDRRLRIQAAAAGLMESGGRRRPLKVPDSAKLAAIRFDTVQRKSRTNSDRNVPKHLQKWVALYTHADVEPLLVLLEEGIHYVHLDFEQLQFIRSARDCLGVPLMAERVISNALWQQMELRQRVMNAGDVDLELGLSVQCIDEPCVGSVRNSTVSGGSAFESRNGKAERKETDAGKISGTDLDSGSWDDNGKSRKFWIPSSDCNIVMGGHAEPIIATSSNTMLQRHAGRLSATVPAEDMQWAADFTSATTQPRLLSIEGQTDAIPMTYTHFPPFRFAAEFPNPRSLKEKKRVYSRTVFYAGSLWNIYIQKVASSRSKQLGVYLHRAKERETEDVLTGTAGLAHGSVDDRIGQLEREMLLRSERHERRQRRRNNMMPGLDALDGDGADSSDNAGDQETMRVGGSTENASPPGTSGLGLVRNLFSRGHYKSGQTDVTQSAPATASYGGFPSNASLSTQSDSDNESEDSEDERLATRFHVPTLPPYVDARPTIKTYFKIYSPSRGGRMLSVYESAPDRFNFSQSWGWKSSTLMLDEGLMGDDSDTVLHKEEQAEAGVEEKDGIRRAGKERGDGKLRFMVVIGNI